MIIQTSFPVKPVSIFSPGYFHSLFFRKNFRKCIIRYLLHSAEDFPSPYTENRETVLKSDLQAKCRFASDSGVAFPGSPAFSAACLFPARQKSSPQAAFYRILIRCRWKESVRCCHSAAAEAENPDDHLPSSALLPEHRWNDT